MPATWGGGRWGVGEGETQGCSCMTASHARLEGSYETD